MTSEAEILHRVTAATDKMDDETRKKTERRVYWPLSLLTVAMKLKLGISKLVLTAFDGHSKPEQILLALIDMEQEHRREMAETREKLVEDLYRRMMAEAKPGYLAGEAENAKQWEFRVRARRSAAAARVRGDIE